MLFLFAFCILVGYWLAIMRRERAYRTCDKCDLWIDNECSCSDFCFNQVWTNKRVYH